MLIIALSIDNIDPTRQYPVAWDMSPFADLCCRMKMTTQQKLADPMEMAAAETPASQDPREVV